MYLNTLINTNDTIINDNAFRIPHVVNYTHNFYLALALLNIPLNCITFMPIIFHYKELKSRHWPIPLKVNLCVHFSALNALNPIYIHRHQTSQCV